MADALANIAMDTKTSTQVLEADLECLPSAWSPVTESLIGDIGHWLAAHPDPDDDPDVAGRYTDSGVSPQHACASTRRCS
ncbi:hypothetical protein ON010_g17131 [Phytophthora cinnamomi]|nr:hypothetical protein ON010_g17131 [Phytophthora cinnamomi]